MKGYCYTCEKPAYYKKNLNSTQNTYICTCKCHG